MEYDPLTLRGRMWTMPEIVALLVKANNMGLPLESGSWVEKMTIAEIDRFVNGVHDA